MAQPSAANKASRPESPLPAPTVAGQKRKRPADKKYYAVKVGKTPGVYDTWDQCLAQVTGQKGAQFKSFTSQGDAQLFVEGKLIHQANKAPGEQKFYAVQQGKVPGVYTDWPTAQAQISGFKNPKHKKFTTRAEAEAFISEGKRKSAYDNGTGISPEEEIRRLIVKNSAPGLVTNGDYVAKDKHGNEFELARGPLPPGAEDGFDPNVKLDNGVIRRRTEEEKSTLKKVPKDSNPPGMLNIYTDGSSLSNGQVGARAGVGVYFGPAPFEYDSQSPSSSSPVSDPGKEIPMYTVDWQARGAPSTMKRRKLTWRYRNISEALKGTKQTNQRAELTAIQRALEVVPSHRDVTIFTDSRYSIDCVTNWYRNWQSNGWHNSKGKPVENRDVIQEIREKIEERNHFGKQTHFVWVKGHDKNEGNIRADELAVAGARRGLHGDAQSSSAGNETTTGTESGEGEAEEDSEDERSDERKLEDAEMEAALQLRQEALDAMDTSTTSVPNGSS
ncbi:hypothetical protein LTR05_003361 [Lithohypha guttulata]|uniref:Ribonuclease H n=1 Tax=Lithohypha guttulata TaxID=1690604 RepID=A0AAN7T3N6_9EURO|nr:hypothetical protein LTR05_003361 [Lithohypha guttulata]